MNIPLAQILIGTVVLGSLYAVVGVGFVILFRSTGVVNLAQGGFMVLSAYVFYALVVTAKQPFVLSVVITLVILAVVGVAIYVLLFRRLVGADPFVLVIATLGLSVLIEVIVQILWGPEIRTLPLLLGDKPLADFGGGFRISALDIFSVGLAAVLIVGLELGLQRTRLGIRMRAVADAPLLAALNRVDVHWMSALAWGIAALCASAAGMAYALRTSVDAVGLSSLGLLAFPAVLIGGMDSIRGALVGGLLLALAQNIVIMAVGGAWQDPIAYIILLIVLLVRPRGLFGRREVVRV
jgi:branched-chain amino acid transport system permease protein